MRFNPCLRFLVIEQNSDSRFLLVKALLRTFPTAAILECQHGETALREARDEGFNAVIVHRTFEYEGLELVAMIHEVNATVPIIMVSGHDRAAEALAAGATLFLNYDEWARIGTIVEAILAARQLKLCTPK